MLAILVAAFASFQYDVPGRLGWSAPAEGPAAVEPPPGLELPALPDVDPVAGSLTPGTVLPAKVRKALAPYLSDPDLGSHVVVAVAQPGGDQLFETGNGAATPASTMKLLTTVAAVALGLPEYDRSAVHHARLARADLRAATTWLTNSGRAERSAVPTIHPGRVDVIGAGALILQRLFDRMTVGEVIVSEHDILDGVALSLG